MAYITPRVQIQQEFLQLPIYSARPLAAFILGPQYHLARYSEPAEKRFTALGLLNGVALPSGNAYNPTESALYDLPNIPVGAVADEGYTKLYAEKVVAQYFPLDSLGGTGMGGDVVELVSTQNMSTFPNKVRFPNLVLKTNNTNLRANQFVDRDVAVGDYIEVSNGTESVFGRITALQPDSFVEDGTLGAVVDNTIAGNLNAPTQTALLNAAPGLTSGTATDFVVSNTTTAYYGVPSKGIVYDTFTVTVTRGKTTSDSLNALRFSISSASGAFTTQTDRVLDVDGTEGTLTLDSTNTGIGNNAVSLLFVQDNTPSTLAVGTTWTLDVRAHVVASEPESGGTYTGKVDMTYKLLVERGGPLYTGSNSTTCARLLVSASDVDTQTYVLPKANTGFNVGSYGVQASFNAGAIAGTGSALIAGDIYYITVTAAKEGAIKTVQFSETLPAALVEDYENLTAKLFLYQPVKKVESIRDQISGDRNWAQLGNQIEVYPGISTYDDKLTAGGSVAQLPFRSAELYAEHRDLMIDHTAAIDSASSLSEVMSKLGTVHPDNPLAQAVYDAVLNSANQRVYFIGLKSDDLAGYAAAIKISEKSDTVYSFVPLSFDKDVQEAVVAHVEAYSTPQVARWRIAWLSVQDKPTAVTYSVKDDGQKYTATVTDDPAILGAQYQLLTVAGADFLADDGFGDTKLRANDIVRINFRLDPNGKEIYDEYIVSRVTTNTTCILATPLSSPIASAVTVQIVRNYTKAERARNIAALAGSYNNRRVRVVFPDSYKDENGIVKQGYIAAAGLAGLRSGVVPHQGLTNSEFKGAYDLSKVVIDFQQSDLDTMAEKGVWLISQAIIGSTAYVRHQLTSNTSNLNTSEDSITTNVDSISYALRDILAPFIGRYNINNENIEVVRGAIAGELTYRATGTFTSRAGNQLTSFNPQDDIVSIAVDPVFKDKINVEVRLHLPYPLNYLNLKLIAGA